jgi:hypothetical protein
MQFREGLRVIEWRAASGPCSRLFGKERLRSGKLAFCKSETDFKGMYAIRPATHRECSRLLRGERQEAQGAAIDAGNGSHRVRIIHYAPCL